MQDRNNHKSVENIIVAEAADAGAALAHAKRIYAAIQSFRIKASIEPIGSWNDSNFGTGLSLLNQTLSTAASGMAPDLIRATIDVLEKRVEHLRKAFEAVSE